MGRLFNLGITAQKTNNIQGGQGVMVKSFHEY